MTTADWLTELRSHSYVLALSSVEREELLVERIGERIYSRLCEMCDFVSLPARTDDYRRTKQDGRPSRRPVRSAR